MDALALKHNQAAHLCRISAAIVKDLFSQCYSSLWMPQVANGGIMTTNASDIGSGDHTAFALTGGAGGSDGGGGGGGPPPPDEPGPSSTLCHSIPICVFARCDVILSPAQIDIVVALLIGWLGLTICVLQRGVPVAVASRIHIAQSTAQAAVSSKMIEMSTFLCISFCCASSLSYVSNWFCICKCIGFVPAAGQASCKFSLFHLDADKNPHHMLLCKPQSPFST
jgi:hypothetical protein